MGPRDACGSIVDDGIAKFERRARDRSKTSALCVQGDRRGPSGVVKYYETCMPTRGVLYHEGVQPNEEGRIVREKKK